MKRLTLIFAMLLVAAGCASDKKSNPPTTKRTQADALRDPFGYGPGKDFAKDGINAADKDDSLKDEWKRFWDP